MDYASSLMWQQSGADKYMEYEKAKEYVDQLNRDQFAGYSDWRLPTLEETMSLMEPTKNKNGLYIDPLFDKNSSGFGHLINTIALRAPGLSISASVIAATSTPTIAIAVCVLFAEDNHGLFDNLNHLIIYSEKS